MWQHIKLSVQIRPWDTLACYWDVKQPRNSGQRRITETVWNSKSDPQLLYQHAQLSLQIRHCHRSTHALSLVNPPPPPPKKKKKKATKKKKKKRKKKKEKNQQHHTLNLHFTLGNVLSRFVLDMPCSRANRSWAGMRCSSGKQTGVLRLSQC